MMTTTATKPINRSGQAKAGEGEGKGKPSLSRRRCEHQRSRSTCAALHANAVAVAGLAAVAAVAAVVSGFPRAGAFFVAPAAPCSAAGAVKSRGVGRGVAAAVNVCRGHERGERTLARMSSEPETDSSFSGSPGDKPQFVPSREMTTSTKEILPPPDREAAMKMVAEREAKEMALGDAQDAAYNSAEIQDLPQPPYFFKTPGEFGNNTLCTDPQWHTALLAFKWLGLPYEVEHEDDEDEAMLVMGDEVYDDPEQLLSGLPERVLLSDFVDSWETVNNAIAKLEQAWKKLHFNRVGKTSDIETDEKRLNKCLQKIENILLEYGPSRGPFMEGDELTIGDFRLAVTMYHMLAAFDIEKQWKMSDELVRLKAHMDLLHGMQIFQRVMPSPQDLAKKYALDV